MSSINDIFFHGTINVGLVYNKKEHDFEVLARIFQLLGVKECAVKSTCEKISVAALLERVKNNDYEANFTLLLQGFEFDLKIGKDLTVTLSKEEDEEQKCWLFCIDTRQLFDCEGSLYSKEYKKCVTEAEKNITDFMRKMLSVDKFIFAFCDSNASLYNISGRDFQQHCTEFALAASKDEKGRIKEVKNPWLIDGLTERAVKSETRIYEEEVLAFFVEKIPKIADFTKNVFDLYEETEPAGLYIVVEGNVTRFLDEAVQKHNKKEIKQFFEVWLEFTKIFAADHQKYEKETIQNFTRVALFEEIHGFENSKEIADLLPKELKEDYFFCWN